ncbi:MAG: hypothetical protein ABWU16_02460 [Halothiobacillaceae bacterium]
MSASPRQRIFSAQDDFGPVEVWRAPEGLVLGFGNATDPHLAAPSQSALLERPALHATDLAVEAATLASHDDLILTDLFDARGMVPALGTQDFPAHMRNAAPIGRKHGLDLPLYWRDLVCKNPRRFHA